LVDALELTNEGHLKFSRVSQRFRAPLEVPGLGYSPRRLAIVVTGREQRCDSWSSRSVSEGRIFDSRLAPHWHQTGVLCFNSQLQIRRLVCADSHRPIERCLKCPLQYN